MLYAELTVVTDRQLQPEQQRLHVAEIAYIPFISSNVTVWPWANVRVGLQYTYYNKFDGTTMNAHDNNTLFLYAWIAM